MTETKRTRKTAAAALVKRPEIFGYHDYRQFLNDWLAYRKASQPGFSMRALSKEAAMAPGLLPMIVGGTRHLSGKALAKLAPVLGLLPTERSFLDILVTLGTTDSQEVRLDALKRMKRFGAYQRQSPRETEVYEYLTRWHYVAIRELTFLPDFKADPEWIQKRLRVPVPLGEIKEALKFLLENGYLLKDRHGNLRAEDKRLDCAGGVYRVALTQFHHEMLGLAAQAIDHTPSNEREIQGHTFAVSAKSLQEARKILTEAFEKIRHLDEGENEIGNGSGAQREVDSVYHMEVALFPLTRARPERK